MKWNKSVYKVKLEQFISNFFANQLLSLFFLNLIAKIDISTNFPCVLTRTRIFLYDKYRTMDAVSELVSYLILFCFYSFFFF